MTTPHLEVVPVGNFGPKSVIWSELMVSRRAGLHSVVHEIVRAVAHASTAGGAPVTDHALLDRATAACEPVVDQAPVKVRALVFDAVEELEAMGDLAQLANGNWVCSPPYLVAADGAKGSLLIGGLPVRALASEIRSRVHIDGAARWIEQGSSTSLPVVGLDMWARDPGQPISEWAADVVNSDLRPPDTETVNTAHYRFYLPGNASRYASQDARWFPTSTNMSGRHLARVRSVTGRLEQQIVQLENGRVTAARSIDSDSARRLMYGLDRAGANPTRARLHRATGGRASDVVTVKVTNPLPRAETRQLVAVAKQSRKGEWNLPLEYARGVPALVKLGIELQMS